MEPIYIVQPSVSLDANEMLLMGTARELLNDAGALVINDDQRELVGFVVNRKNFAGLSFNQQKAATRVLLDALSHAINVFIGSGSFVLYDIVTVDDEGNVECQPSKELSFSFTCKNDDLELFVNSIRFVPIKNRINALLKELGQLHDLIAKNAADGE